MISKLRKFSLAFVVMLTFMAGMANAVAQEAPDPWTKQKFADLEKDAAHGVVGIQVTLAFFYYKPNTPSSVYSQQVEGVNIPKDNKKAWGYFKQAAESGDAQAQTYVGFFYDRGMVVNRDYKAALKWYQSAAAQGYPRAEDLIGRMYRDGHGVPQSYRLAAQFFEKSALQYTISTIHLARLYSIGGSGFPQDHEKAFFWLNLPANPAWRKLRKEWPDDLCCESEDFSHSYYNEVKSHLTPMQIKKVQEQVKNYKLPAPTKWSPPSRDALKTLLYSHSMTSQPNNSQR